LFAQQVASIPPRTASLPCAACFSERPARSKPQDAGGGFRHEGPVASGAPHATQDAGEKSEGNKWGTKQNSPGIETTLSNPPLAGVDAVRDAMTADVASCYDDQPIRDAAGLLQEHRAQAA